MNAVPRLHVNTGAHCNNNCQFCAEDDREGRARMVGLQTPDDYLEILSEFPHRDHVCFTTGEPTLNPLLPWLVRTAADLGYREVALITNGRRLGDEAYLARLLDAGLNVLTVSIHGGNARLHDGLTRTRGSFAQTVRGIRAAAATDLRLHTSTVITRRNLHDLRTLLALLGRVGVEQAVLNVAKPRGRAHDRAPRVLARYDEIARTLAETLSELGPLSPPVFLEDIPLCATQGIPESFRGTLEDNVRFDLVEAPGARPRYEAHDRAWTERALRTKRPECSRCSDEPGCPGVWTRYLEVHGWVGLGSGT